MPRLAANLTMLFNEHPFIDRFPAASAAGFRAVEFLFPYDHPAGQVAEALAESGLRLALFNMPPGDWSAGDRGLAALPGRRDEFRASLAVAIAYGGELGTPLLHMMAGIAPRDDPAAAAAYRYALELAADETAAAGIGLVIEPLNSRDVPGYFLDSFDRAADLIAQLAHPNLKLQFDIYHRQIMHGDVTKALDACRDMIGHVQIASVPERHEPGTGELDDFRILRHLDAIGYDGYVGCEYFPAAGTLAGLGWRDAIRTA